MFWQYISEIKYRQNKKGWPTLIRHFFFLRTIVLNIYRVFTSFQNHHCNFSGSRPPFAKYTAQRKTYNKQRSCTIPAKTLDRSKSFSGFLFLRSDTKKIPIAFRSPAIDFPTPGILSNELASIFFFTRKFAVVIFSSAAQTVYTR